MRSAISPALHLALVLSFFAWAQGLAQAEEASLYRSVVASALDEYELGNYEEARSLFERAHALEPSARTLRGIGMAAYQARKYVIALGYLQAALTDQRKPLTPPMRREVQSALEAAQGFIARYELLLSPSNASAAVDGELVRLQDGLLLLDPGEHELVVSAGGYKTEVRRLNATSARQGRIEVQLTPVSGEVVAATSTSASPPPETTRPSSAGKSSGERVPLAIKALTIGSFSLALAGAVVATVGGLKAVAEERRLAQVCPDKMCPAERSGQLSEGKRWATASTASLAVGGVGLAAGIVGIVLWVRHTRRTGETPRSSLEPLFLARGIGLQGRF
jgi:hypothetical protein